MHTFDLKDLDWFFRPSLDYQVRRYPLTDIAFDKKTKDILISVAVAGFDKNEIELEQRNNHLYIRGKKKENNLDEELDYIQRHISEKDFERIIVLHEDYVNGNVRAELKNGILNIRITPKEKDRNIIEING